MGEGWFEPDGDITVRIYCSYPLCRHLLPELKTLPRVDIDRLSTYVLKIESNTPS